jgi:hypothetical protein
MVMRHCRDRNAIGPIRAVASRAQEVIGAVLGIAAVVHPAADLARLANLPPSNLNSPSSITVITPLPVRGEQEHRAFLPY